MSVDNVADSTDWLSTPLSGLAAVEAALRCQVCKDLFKTPMVTSCSHTFCSLCIRRALSNDGKCPLCRAPEQELKLRSNWSLEEAVEAFSVARPAALSLARNALRVSPSPKRKGDDDQEPAERQPKRLRTSERVSKARAEAIVAHTPSQTAKDIVEASDDENEDVLDDPDGHVPCPVCQRKMKAWQVFQHLETCPGPPTRRHGTRSNITASTFGQAQRRQDKILERLPALNYSMLREQALRKKMTELGLSSQGPRPLLEKRHREWMTLWNANCDAAQPKKRSELLQDLDVWERTQGGRTSSSGRTFEASAAIKGKDFDGAAWAAKHDSSFKHLIASARRSRTDAKSRMEGGASGLPTVDQADVGTTVSDPKCRSSLPPQHEDGLRDSGGPDGATEPQLDFKHGDGIRSGGRLDKATEPQLDAKESGTAHPSASSILLKAAALSTNDPTSEPALGTLDAPGPCEEAKQKDHPRDWETPQASEPPPSQAAHLDPDG